MRISNVIYAALALSFLWANDASAQPLRPPSYLYVTGIGSANPLIEGTEYQLNFSGGAYGTQTELSSGERFQMENVAVPQLLIYSFS